MQQGQQREFELWYVDYIQKPELKHTSFKHDQKTSSFLSTKEQKKKKETYKKTEPLCTVRSSSPVWRYN